MIPLRVYVENFMSYREGQELLFDGAPLWVLAGPNGAGKSTIFDAMTFALYGLHRGGKKHKTDLINHQADVLTVEFDFLVDKEAYRVRRTVPRSGNATREVFRLISFQCQENLHIEPIPDTDNDSGFKDWIKRTIGLNDEAFTSCVLLMQGKSDKIIDAKPTERYEILKQLINLLPYERLHQLADAHRKKSESKVKILESKVGSVPSVSDVEFNTVAAARNQREEIWKSAQIKVEERTTILEQAKQWKQLKSQICEAKNDLQKFHDLLASADEIERKFNRFQELEQVLPLLSSIIEQGKRLVDKEKQIEQLQQGFQQIQARLDKAESEKNDAENQVDQLEKEIEQLQTNSNDLANHLLELAPLVEKISQLEAIQTQLHEREQKLAAYPPDLAQAVKQAEEQDDQLAEMEKALPWLRELAQNRSDLAYALNAEKVASDEFESLEIQLQEHQNSHEKLSADIAVVSEKEKNLSAQVTRAQTVYELVCQRRDRFEQAACQPTCELCGQEITPEHANTERARLDAQIATEQANLNTLESQYKKARENLNGLKANLEVLNQQLTSINNKRNQTEKQREQAKRDAEQFVVQVNKAFNNLPTTYQVRVSPYVPSEDLGWLDTTYPTDTDLEELSQQVSTRQALARSLKELRRQFEDRQRLDAERQSYSNQLAAMETNLPLCQARKVRSEQTKLQQAQEQLQSQLKERKTEQKQLKIKANKTNEAINTLSNELQQSQRELDENRGVQGEIKRRLQSDLESLPQVWQERANTIDSDALEELITESQRLAKYEDLSRELDIASKSVVLIEERISKLNTEIEQLPQEARCAAEEVEKELESAKTQRDEADQNRLTASQHYDQLVFQREQRLQLEKDLRKAQRDRDLYELLSDLLGSKKKGLQLHLLRRAELAIVELANEILDGLSRGRMRLELRGEAEETSSESSKALDLVVYNDDIGSYPTPIAQISGSQRFRVAVSLALAIGQYAGQGSRRIESVIIDEGFGSLDKNGRDDMIQELNELQQRLARIILVSHLEDFSSAFANGYSIKLVGCASQVSLLEHA